MFQDCRHSGPCSLASAIELYLSISASALVDATVIDWRKQIETSAGGKPDLDDNNLPLFDCGIAFSLLSLPARHISLFTLPDESSDESSAIYHHVQLQFNLFSGFVSVSWSAKLAYGRLEFQHALTEAIRKQDEHAEQITNPVHFPTH